MKADDLKTSDYLTEGDVTPPIRVTVDEPIPYIKNMAKDGQPVNNKTIISLVGMKKKFCCNITNFKLIARNVGKPDSDNWVGESFDIWFNPDIEYGSEIVGGIRVMTPQPQVQAPTQAPPVADDEVPF